jgi:hypothetical protein
LQRHERRRARFDHRQRRARSQLDRDLSEPHVERERRHRARLRDWRARRARPPITVVEAPGIERSLREERCHNETVAQSASAPKALLNSHFSTFVRAPPAAGHDRDEVRSCPRAAVA